MSDIPDFFKHHWSGHTSHGIGDFYIHSIGESKVYYIAESLNAGPGFVLKKRVNDVDIHRFGFSYFLISGKKCRFSYISGAEALFVLKNHYPGIHDDCLYHIDFFARDNRPDSLGRLGSIEDIAEKYEI